MPKGIYERKPRKEPKQVVVARRASDAVKMQQVPERVHLTAHNIEIEDFQRQVREKDQTIDALQRDNIRLEQRCETFMDVLRLLHGRGE